MSCERFRDRLLEADPEELSGEGGGPLAGHLATCPRCAAAARGILEAERALAVTLDERATAPSPAVVDAVLRGARRRGRPAGARRRVLWAPALAAAAVLALLLWPEGPPDALLDPVAVAGPGAARPVHPIVEVPAGRDAAVFSTNDPSITIVWFFGGGEG